MLIALDFDDTYTRDPFFWDSFIHDALMSGHKVICVTYRNNYKLEDNLDIKISLENVIPIIYTNGKQKRQVAKSLGYHVDIWIDDMPELIP